MLKKKLISLGIAVVFTLSSLTTTVFAADFNKTTGTNVAIKVVTPGRGNGNGQIKDNKNNEKKFKFNDSKDVAWALNAIEKLAGKGILGGVGQGRFAPQNKVTQLEALAMVLRLTGDNNEAENRKNQIHPLYNGVKPLWGAGYIFVAIEKGILLPEELGNFNPNTPAKRHEIAKYIIRAMGKTDEALKYMDEELTFKDSSAVPKESVGYVYLINELNIMVGNNNMFKPMEPVTRAEMAVLLNRADGEITLPDSDTRKNNTVFVSADTDDNKITVKVKGVTTTYDFVKGVQVYKNDSFETVGDLVEGNVLQLTFNDKKEVIFIEVVKNAEDNNEAEETELSVSQVSYSNLPDVLRDEVDNLKTNENYKAYEYNSYIYLLAAMGKKSTGGYSIVFDEVYKVENDNDYTVKAVIDTNKPSSNQIVTQSITYPYSIVKFKSFDNINSVKFVDTDNDKLAEKEIVKLDEDEAVTETVEGTISFISSSSNAIKVEKSNGSVVTLTIPDDAEITVNDDENENFSDLEKGMKVEIEITDNEVTKVIASDNTTEVTGILTVISISTDKKITLRVGNTSKTYIVASDVKVTIDGETAELEDLQVNCELTLKFANGILVEIEKE